MTMTTNELAVVANIDDLVAGNDGRHHLKMGTRREGGSGCEQPRRERARESLAPRHKMACGCFSFHIHLYITYSIHTEMPTER